jgi:hypothetical protein
MAEQTPRFAGDGEAFAGDGPEKRYLDFLRAGEIKIQQCNACGAHVFYPRVVCTSCGSGDLAWVDISGDATVYSATTISEKPEAGGPRNFSIVELAEGPRLFSRVEGLAPEDVVIGMALKARIATSDAVEFPFLVFDPA